MSARLAWLGLALGVLGVILNDGLADGVTVWGFRPDFVLAFLTPIALALRPGVAAAVWLVPALLAGGLEGANLTHNVFSRVVTAFLLAWVGLSRLDLSLAVIGLVTAVATVTANLLYMLTAAPPDIGGFLGATIRMAVYNGVIAMPIGILLRRFVLSLNRTGRSI